MIKQTHLAGWISSRSMGTYRNTYWRTATIRVQHAYIFGFVWSMVFFGYPFVWFPSSFACYICIISVFWFFPSFWILYDIFMKKWSRLVCLLFFFVHPSKPSRRPLKPRWKNSVRGRFCKSEALSSLANFSFSCSVLQDFCAEASCFSWRWKMGMVDESSWRLPWFEGIPSGNLT